MFARHGNFNFLAQPLYYQILLSSLFGTIGLMLMVQFLKEGSFTLFSYYAFFGIALNGLMTFVFGGVHLTSTAVLASVIILVGYILFVLDERKTLKREPVRLSQHLVLIAMTLSFSLSTFISWKALRYFDPLELMLTQELTVLVVTGILSVVLIKKHHLSVPKFSPKYPFLALVIMLAVFAGFKGLKLYNPFITSISGVISPALTLIAAVLLFKEKINRTQIVSFLIILTGILVFVNTD
jgi:drug/metabolite transporter (DMT)-like permease